MIPEQTFSRILVLQTAFLGDAILSSPLLRSLTEVFPDVRIDVLCIPETAGLFRQDPHVQGVLEFRKRNIFTKLPSFLALLGRIRKQRYELAISVQSSLTSSLLMAAGGVPERVGFTRQKLITRGVKHQQGLHKAQKILKLLEPFTERQFDIQTDIHLSQTHLERAAAVVDQAKPGVKKVGVAPGSIWPTKRWLPEYYSRIVGELAGKQVAVFLIGGKGDRELCEMIKGETSAVNAAGELTVLESSALIKRMDLLITNDSAPLHMANAVRTDVIALFGPTVRRLGFYPFREHDKVMEAELECRPCGTHGGKQCPLKHFRCMRTITPGRVLAEAVRTLGI